MSLIDVIDNAISRVGGELSYWVAIMLGALSRIEYEKPVPMPNPAVLENMVAEAAYYRAGERCFEDGYDMGDWLEAEKEILARFSST